MENNKSWWSPSNLSGNNSSYVNIQTEPMKKIYLFTPAGVTAKRLLCSVFSIIGVMGFLANCVILYFLWKKPKRSPIQSSPFMRNLNLYVRSLCLSDLLSCVLSLPFILIQISFDVFQTGWACKVARYINFIFPAITINSLVVISLEKYLSTRTVPRTFSVSTVRKLIVGAWALGVVVILFPAAPYDGIRVELNDTHYTIICFFNQDFYPFRLTFIFFPVQYVLPCVFVTTLNICLMKTIWNRRRRQIGNGMPNNAFRANLRAATLKGTTLLVFLSFSFIIPCFLFIANIVYTQVAKPQRDFPTAYMMRYGTGSTAYLSGVFNFIIYFAQMKDFRDFLKKLLCRRSRATQLAASREMNNERLDKKTESSKKNCPSNSTAEL